MADEYGPSGNFINPDYATPEQIAQLRRYSELLQQNATAPDAKSWTGVLAHALMGLKGNMNMNNANQMQRQVLQQGANAGQDVAANNPAAAVVLGQNPMQPQASMAPAPGGNNALKAAILMQESGNRDNIGRSSAGAIGPGQIMPNTFAAVARPGENINNPLDNRAVSARLLDSYEQKYGDPARAAVAYFSGPGNVAPPGSPTPWIADRRDPNGKSVSSYVSDVTRRMGGQPQQMAQNNSVMNFMMTPGVPQELKDRVMNLNTPIPVQDVTGRTGVQEGVMGDTHLTPVQPGFTQGFRSPATVGPDGGVSGTVITPAPGAGGNVPSMSDQLGKLWQTGQDFAMGSTANKALRGGVESDIQATQAAIPIMQNLDLMADEIKAHGDNMNFGPSADFMTNMKRIVANHAPGLMSEAEMKGLAAQENVRKINSLLMTSVGRQTGNTDLSLLTGERSVPGEQNSAQGNLAIIDMLKQQVGLNSRFVMENLSNYKTSGFNPIEAKTKFYKDNPIINPLTHNPITVDLAKGEKVTPSQVEFKKLSNEELKKRLGIQ